MIFSSLQSFYINCKHSNTFKLFRFYWQCFNTILSFLLYLLGENKFVYSTKLLPFNMKVINPIQGIYTLLNDMLALEIFVVM